MVEMSPVMRAPAKAGAQSPERNACGSGSPLSRGYWADGPSSEHHHRSGRVALAQFVERVVDPLKRQPLGDDRVEIEEAAEVKVDQAWNLDRKAVGPHQRALQRSDEHTSELQSLMRISHAVF